MKYILECTDEQKDNILKVFNNVKISKESKSDLSRWKPEVCQSYYYIDSDGIIVRTLWCDHNVDYLKYNIGNVFRTYDEAQFAVDQRRVYMQLRDLSDDHLDWDGFHAHWHIVCSKNGEELTAYYNLYAKYPQPGIVYFKSKRSVENAIRIIGEDKLKKYLF